MCDARVQHGELKWQLQQISTEYKDHSRSAVWKYSGSEANDDDEPKKKEMNKPVLLHGANRR